MPDFNFDQDLPRNPNDPQEVENDKQNEAHLADLRGQAYQWAYNWMYAAATEAMLRCKTYTAEEGALAGMRDALKAFEETS